MKHKFLLGALFSALLIFTLIGFAQDTGGEMTGGMMDDMTGGEMTGGAMTGGMSEMDSSEMDAMLESLMQDSSATGGSMDDMDTSSMTIAEVVAANPDFGILAQLVQSAGLLETLNGEGPFTVFAPSDSAFLPFTNTDIVSLLSDTDALTNVLTYHVVDGELTSEDLMSMSSVTTLQGGELTIGEGMAMGDMTGGDMSMSGMTGGEMTGGEMTGGEMSEMGPSLMVGSANVVTADIVTANGVIHVIDSVLMPE